MRKPRIVFRPVFLSLLSIGWSVALHGETQTRTHVTIRGTGKDVSIERTEMRTEEPKPLEIGPAPGVLEEAIRKKEKGVTDEALIGFLRAHAAELPSFIDFDSVTRLRSAGAGRSVIAYLAGASAVEIGPTGAVGGATASSASLPDREAEPEYEPEYGVPYGISTGGGISRHAGSHFFRRPMMARPAMTHLRPTSPVTPMAPRPDRPPFRR